MDSLPCRCLPCLEVCSARSDGPFNINLLFLLLGLEVYSVRSDKPFIIGELNSYRVARPHAFLLGGALRRCAMRVFASVSKEAVGIHSGGIL